MINLFSEFVDEHLVQHVHPVVNTKTYRVEFFEILSRVYYKNTLYQPSSFLNEISSSQKHKIAERNIIKAIEFQKQYPNLSFSINISNVDMESGIIRLLRDLAENKMIKPENCIIEVLETNIITNLVKEQMEKLKSDFGYRFALDDFGSGYSNLKQMQYSNGLFEYIKIDGSLAQGIVEDQRKKRSLELMIFTIQDHGKKAIVEHVSNCNSLEIIEQISPDFLQGFVFGLPEPIEKYAERIIDGIILPCNIDKIFNKNCNVCDRHQNCKNKK